MFFFKHKKVDWKYRKEGIKRDLVLFSKEAAGERIPLFFFFSIEPGTELILFFFREQMSVDRRRRSRRFRRRLVDGWRWTPVRAGVVAAAARSVLRSNRNRYGQTARARVVAGWLPPPQYFTRPRSRVVSVRLPYRTACDTDRTLQWRIANNN